MSKVKILATRAPGTNCDTETVYAFEKAGGEVDLVHVNRLIRREVNIADYRIFVIPGGFTYGDDIAAGKILANELKLRLGEDISRFIESGGLIIGICNGFQTLVKAGFLPDMSADSQQVTLAHNDSGKFECRWIHLKVNKSSPCVFTKGMDSMYIPVNHGEGKLVTLTDCLTDENIVVQYTDEKGNTGAGYPHNPNGSERDIAGICDATGRVFGLMPHPERHILGTQHPQWTRLGAKETGDGFQVFKNAVDWAAHL